MVGRALSTIVALSTGVGCMAPPAPALPPQERIPLLERAAECPPTIPFAQRTFLAADLESGRSCEVFIEQDECVLAIYDDCTANPRFERQWVGQIDLSGGVILEAIIKNHATRTERCEGTIQREPNKMWVQCPNRTDASRGIYFEEKLSTPSMERFGDKVAVGTTTKIGAGQTFDVALVGEAGARELWFTLAEPMDGGRSSIVVYEPVTGIVHRFHTPRFTHLAASDLHAVAAGPDAVVVYDVSGRAVAERPADHSVLGDVAIGTAGIYLSRELLETPQLTTVTRYDTQLGSIGPSLVVPEHVHKIVVTPQAIALVGRSRVNLDFGAIYVVDHQLRIQHQVAVDFVVADAIAVDGHTIGLAPANHNAYFELDLESGTLGSPIPNPFFAVVAVTHDPASDTVFLGANARVQPLRRAGQYIAQNGFVGANPLSTLLFDDSTRTLFSISQSAGTIESIELAQQP